MLAVNEEFAHARTLEKDKLVESLKQRLKDTSAHHPRCSNDKTAKHTRPFDLSWKYEYRAINDNAFKSWIVVDLDHENPLAYMDFESKAPIPNLIVIDKEKLTSHYFYAIEPVCVTGNARIAPIEYLKAVRDGLRKSLKGDPCFTEYICRTPFNKRWRTIPIHDKVYSLGEMADYVEIKQKKVVHFRKNSIRINDGAEGRNDTIFNATRYATYGVVERFRNKNDKEGLYQWVMDYAESINTAESFSDMGVKKKLRPLKTKEIEHITKSITNWCWDNYTGSGQDVNRGVMGLDKSLTIKERQKLSAERTNEERKNKTLRKIIEAIKEIGANSATISKIVKATLLCRQTVSKFIDEARKKASKELLHKGVNYGVYQVVAPQGHSFYDVKKKPKHTANDDKAHKIERKNVSKGNIFLLQTKKE